MKNFILKNKLTIVLVIVTLFILYVVASPFITLMGVNSALTNDDFSKLCSYINYPAVDNLDAQTLENIVNGEYVLPEELKAFFKKQYNDKKVYLTSFQLISLDKFSVNVNNGLVINTNAKVIFKRTGFTWKIANFDYGDKK